MCIAWKLILEDLEYLKIRGKTRVDAQKSTSTRMHTFLHTNSMFSYVYEIYSISIFELITLATFF